MNDRFAAVLKRAVAENVSDIHLAAGQRIFFRQNGRLYPVGDEAADDAFLRAALVLTDSQRRKLDDERDADFSLTFDARRFRGNVYWQRGRLAMMLRLVPEKIPAIDELGSADILHSLTNATSGMILVTGRTGSGKTTTIASFLNAVNESRARHILTLEDPIEYVYRPQKSFISQREYGADFYSFPHAVKSALREMPDIILVGEMRDAETMRAALTAAQTGVLVLGTLHTKNAAEATMRVEGMFPAGERDAVRSQFAETIAAVLSQRLVPSADGGRVCAMEVLLATDAARSIIRQGKYGQLHQVMMSGRRSGMQTADVALQRLYDDKLITAETLKNFSEGI